MRPRSRGAGTAVEGPVPEARHLRAVGPGHRPLHLRERGRQEGDPVTAVWRHAEGLLQDGPRQLPCRAEHSAVRRPRHVQVPAAYLHSQPCSQVRRITFFPMKGGWETRISTVQYPVLWSRPEPDCLAGAGAGEKAPWLRAVAVWLKGTVVAKYCQVL